MIIVYYYFEIKYSKHISSCFVLLQQKDEFPLWIKPLICRQVVLFITGIVLLFGRWHVMGSSPPVFQVVDNPASFEKSLITRVSSAQST